MLKLCTNFLCKIQQKLIEIVMSKVIKNLRIRKIILLIKNKVNRKSYKLNQFNVNPSKNKVNSIKILKFLIGKSKRMKMEKFLSIT